MSTASDNKGKRRTSPPLPAELRRQLVEDLARLLLVDLERRPRADLDRLVDASREPS